MPPQNSDLELQVSTSDLGPKAHSQHWMQGSYRGSIKYERIIVNYRLHYLFSIVYMRNKAFQVAGFSYSYEHRVVFRGAALLD
jgi:hypothetical protein